MNKKKERRLQHRFNSLNDILAINTMNVGQVINMSMSGLRIKYVLRPSDSFEQCLEISLLNNVGDQYIDNLPCKVVSYTDSSPISPSINLFTREAGVTFNDLTSSQINQLSDFVIHTIFSLERPKS